MNSSSPSVEPVAMKILNSLIHGLDSPVGVTRVRLHQQHPLGVHMRSGVTGTPISHGGRADLVGLLKFLQVPHIPQGELDSSGLNFGSFRSRFKGCARGDYSLRTVLLLLQVHCGREHKV